jgi:hypothetical protein
MAIAVLHPDEMGAAIAAALVSIWAAAEIYRR